MKTLPLKPIVLTALLVGLPAAGVWWAGLPMGRYTQFPPRDLYVEHAPFSWSAFLALAAMECLVLLSAVRALARNPSGPFPPARARFPAWGWASVVALAVSWLMAWTRLDWFDRLQPHTFTPLWLSYIAVANAITFRRAGRCLLTHDTGYLLRLFPWSAGFWWFFEYLNRFVQNWSYQGVDRFHASEYLLFATLSFSTVLPAVMSTLECLAAHGFAAGCDRIAVRPPSAGARILFTGLSFAGLFFLGIHPNALFPLLWLAPFGLALNFQSLELFSRVFPTVGTVIRLSAAALVCGLCWEMWNYFSMARWIYHVPLVNAGRIFEMPVLGYFGYLTFGWECAVLAGLVRNRPEILGRC